VGLDEVFQRSDVVSLHCPLSKETFHMVNRQRLASMLPTAFLLNTSRGPLVDEPALAAALEQGRLAGAAVDVLEREPPAPDNPLVAQPRCIVTPHIAWATHASRARLLAVSAENIRAFLKGEPVNVVNSVKSG
jgi:glycerate dehydrogenase